MRYQVRIDGLERLELALMKKSKVDYMVVVDKSLSQMFNRGASSPGTPVDTGELANSRRKRWHMSGTSFGGSFGYAKEYAPHVEFGHRTRGGGYVPGQRYLKRNVDMQKPLFRRDVLEALRKD